MLTVLAVLSLVAVGLGTFLPARDARQLADAASAVGASPSSTLEQTTAVQSTLAPPTRGRARGPLMLMHQTGPERPMLPLDGAVVRGLVSVELAGDTRAARSVRFVLHDPNGATSELTARAAPFQAALPLTDAAAGSWQLDAVVDGLPSTSTTTALFTVSPL